MDTVDTGSRVDPITLEVVRNKLEGIAEEMQLTLLRSSFSPIVKEGMDCSAGLFTRDGQTLSQATSIPTHLATLIPAMAAVLAAFPADTMGVGDAYVLNDPYCGGTHLPDLAVFVPIVVDGAVVAFSATMVHHQDVGGMAAGSIPTDATEIFQEGIRIPPLKLLDRGRPDETLFAMLRLNVRIPEMFIGDLNAQIAAGTVGARRMGELAARLGREELLAICDELLDRSETMTRQALRRLPQGTFRYVDWLDNDGIELDRRIRIEVAVTIDDGSIHFDFTGTSDQVKGPVNCVASGAQAAAYYAVRALTDPSIPTNGGCFRPVSLHLPEGSLVNPNPPAAVNARTVTIKRTCGCLIGALGQALPDRVPAPAATLSLIMAFAGKRRDGSSFISGELVAAGTGASDHSDGVDCLQTDGTNSMNLPVEALMMDAPIKVHRFGLRRDSGGAGTFRGGLGVVREYEVLSGDVSFSHRGERHFTAASGVFGGGPGAMARSVIHRADGSEEVILSKINTTLRQGERLTVATAGGGGYGDPKARDRARVRADVADGKVSPEAARKVYGLNDD